MTEISPELEAWRSEAVKRCAPGYRFELLFAAYSKWALVKARLSEQERIEMLIERMAGRSSQLGVHHPQLFLALSALARAHRHTNIL